MFRHESPDDKSNSYLRRRKWRLSLSFNELKAFTYMDELGQKDIPGLEVVAGEIHLDVKTAGNDNKTYFCPSKRVATVEKIDLFFNL